MTTITPLEIEKYCTEHSLNESHLFKALAAETRRKTDLPQMMVGTLEGGFLRFLVQISRARRILEIGTFTGYSSLAMALALPKGGRIITCDINPETSRIARKYWNKAGCGSKIVQKLGPAADTIKKLKGSFDFVFIDADKANYVQYWDLCVPRVKRGGLIAVDNVLWSGRVLNPKDDTDRAIVRFNQHVMRDRRVEPCMLPVRDGMTLAVKK